jgi:hypothetical protein
MMKPLLSACYLQSTMPQHRSSMIGIKEAVGALGEIAGSLVVVLASSWLIPQRTFLIGGCIIAGTSLLALFIVKSYRPSLASSTVLTSGIRLAEQPAQPLKRIRLAEQPAQPLKRIRLVEQPAQPLKRILLAEQPAQPLKRIRLVEQPATTNLRSHRPFSERKTLSRSKIAPVRLVPLKAG